MHIDSTIYIIWHNYVTFLYPCKRLQWLISYIHTDNELHTASHWALWTFPCMFGCLDMGWPCQTQHIGSVTTLLQSMGEDYNGITINKINLLNLAGGGELIDSITCSVKPYLPPKDKTMYPIEQELCKCYISLKEQGTEGWYRCAPVSAGDQFQGHTYLADMEPMDIGNTCIDNGSLAHFRV